MTAVHLAWFTPQSDHEGTLLQMTASWSDCRKPYTDCRCIPTTEAIWQLLISVDWGGSSSVTLLVETGCILYSVLITVTLLSLLTQLETHGIWEMETHHSCRVWEIERSTPIVVSAGDSSWLQSLRQNMLVWLHCTLLLWKRSTQLMIWQYVTSLVHMLIGASCTSELGQAVGYELVDAIVWVHRWILGVTVN